MWVVMVDMHSMSMMRRKRQRKKRKRLMERRTTTSSRSVWNVIIIHLHFMLMLNNIATIVWLIICPFSIKIKFNAKEICPK